jgi:hypothetical protein
LDTSIVNLICGFVNLMKLDSEMPAPRPTAERREELRERMPKRMAERLHRAEIKADKRK